jgi:iterative type I PKS product template protein
MFFCLLTTTIPSLGEYAALCISGALSLEDTLTVVATRAKLITDHCRANATGMLACKLTPETAEQMISDNPQLTKLTVTCLNSLDDCVVGGSLDQLDVFKKQCQTTQSIKVKLLDVPYAFHSPTMDPIVEPLHKLGASIKFEDPSIPIFSNVFGRLFEKEDFSSRYFALHARQPVRFAECLQNLQSREVLDRTVFIEVGPHITTLPMVRSTIMSNSCHYLGTLRYGQDAWNSLSTTLAAISLLRIPVEWREVFSGTQAKAISLPGHLLNGSTYVVPYKECRNAIDTVPKTSPDTRTITGFKLLPWLNKEKSSSQKFTLETTLKELESLISGHDVGGTSICPASLFHELALEGAQSVLGGCDGQIYVVEAMNFASPLIYHAENGDHIVTVIITKHDSASIADFKIISFSDKDVAEKSHCSGTICLQTFQAVSSRWSKDKALIKRQRNHFSGIGKDYMSTFRRKVLYETVFTRVVRYSQQYQSLAYLDVADSNLEGIGTFKVPSNNQTGFIAPPIFTDTLLHAAGFIANLAVRSDEVAICSRVQSVEINYPDINYTDHFTIYCSLLEVTGTILADAIVSDASEKVVAVIRGMEFKRLRLHNFQHMLALQSANVEHPEKKYEQPKPPLSTGLSTPSTVSEVRDINIESGNTLNNNVRATLNNIVMECGGFSEKDMDYSKTLNELGIDSLMQIEIISKLTRMFFGHAGLSHHALSECESLESLETTLLSILQSMVATSSTATNTQNSSSEVSDKVNLAVQNHTSTNVMSNNPVTLRIANENNSPLYLFHDGSGQVTQYARLQNHDRSTYAFFDPHFGNDDHLYRSINEMVKLYISQVAESRTRSLILGGKFSCS